MPAVHAHVALVHPFLDVEARLDMLCTLSPVLSAQLTDAKQLDEGRRALLRKRGPPKRPGQRPAAAIVVEDCSAHTLSSFVLLAEVVAGHHAPIAPRQLISEGMRAMMLIRRFACSRMLATVRAAVLHDPAEALRQIASHDGVFAPDGKPTFHQPIAEKDPVGGRPTGWWMTDVSAKLASGGVRVFRRCLHEGGQPSRSEALQAGAMALIRAVVTLALRPATHTARTRTHLTSSCGVATCTLSTLLLPATWCIRMVPKSRVWLSCTVWAIRSLHGG